MKRKTFRTAVMLVLTAASAGYAAHTAQAAGATDTVPRGAPRPQADQLWKCLDTWTDMLGLETAIEAYGIDHPEYPRARTMEELRALIQPTYIANTPMKDAWGTPFRYVASDDGSSYRIVSAGSDRVFEEATWATPAFLSSSARDAVMTSGGWESAREWVIQR